MRIWHLTCSQADCTTCWFHSYIRLAEYMIPARLRELASQRCPKKVMDLIVLIWSSLCSFCTFGSDWAKWGWPCTCRLTSQDTLPRSGVFCFDICRFTPFSQLSLTCMHRRPCPHAVSVASWRTHAAVALCQAKAAGNKAATKAWQI